MMKWTRLQLNTLPIAAMEADKAIQKLQQLLTKVNINAKFEDIEDLNNLRKSIITQIDALDRFYELHYLDSTIPIFHMIKIKLKKAIFKVDNINNDTISIQFLNNRLENKNTQNIKGPTSYRKEEQLSKGLNPSYSNEFKLQIKQSKPNSRLRLRLQSKDNIQRLLEASPRQLEEDTNLMEQEKAYYLRQWYGDPSFDLNNEQFSINEPLFHKTDKKNGEKKESKMPFNKPNIKPTSKNDKNLSPLNKMPSNNNTKYKTIENSKNNGTSSNQASHYQLKTKNNSQINSQKKTAVIAQKTQTVSKKSRLSVSKNKKLKTEGQSIRISEQEGQDNEPGQFRFTIKMSKQEYKNLLKMKEGMKNNKFT